MSAVAEHKQVEEFDLDAAAREVESNIGSLQRAVSRLSFDAFSDPAVREELIAAEHELADAEVEAHRISLARVEQERRAIDAQKAERDAAAEAALEVARRLQGDRERTAKAVDRAAVKHVEAVGEFVKVCFAQQAALRRAGRQEAAHIARPPTFQIEAAFAHALYEAAWNGALRGTRLWIRLGLIPLMHKKPLAESDARPVERLKD